MSGVRSGTAMMALSLFLLIVFRVTIASTNCNLLCSTGSKETRETEGDIEFRSASVNNTVGECRVTIHYPPLSEIELTLVNVSKGYSCQQADYIEIYSSQGRRIASYCVNRNRGIVDANKETLRLRTNAVTIRRYYNMSPSNELLPVKANKVSVHYRRTTPCRHILSLAKTGTIRSPSYPDFSRNSECEWNIYTHKGTTIQLTFESVESSKNCNGSSIEVYDEDNERTQFCGKYQTKTIQSKSSHLLIRMKSTTASAVRFKATYKEIPKCRSIELDRPSQFQYAKQLCVKWVLTAFPGQIAALSFSQTDLHSYSGKSCSGNVVEVWDGESTKVYCNSNAPPKMIRSLKGHTLTVTYRWTGAWHDSSTFHASFTSVSPDKYNANCFVQNMALYFKCSRNDPEPISCDFLCDGAMQCLDNSDEDSCEKKDGRWHKLQVFVIVMGSICASTVTFCVGIVCFRKFISQTGRISDSYGRQLSTSDQATITPNIDLPSPPPGYFNDNEENVPSIIRGTYFFGNEFSQSGIHSAFLFGIPPPTYRSTESLQQLCAADGNNGDGQWQGEMTNFVSRQTSICGGETQSNLPQGGQFVSGVSSGDDVNSTATAVLLVDCRSIEDEGKDNKKLTDSGIENQEVHQQITESTQAAAAAATTESNGTSISHSDAFNPMYV